MTADTAALEGLPGKGVAGAAPPVIVPMKTEQPPSQPPTILSVFESEEGPLLSYALGLVRRRPVAEELVQDAFLRLHEVWSQVENPRAWLYRSIRNMALNHIRDHRREMPLEEGHDAPAPDSAPDEEAGRAEALGVVRLLLAQLPGEDQELIRLKYQEDLKYGEISHRTGLGVGNVGYRLHHLLKNLADALRHAGIEGSRG